MSFFKSQILTSLKHLFQKFFKLSFLSPTRHGSTAIFVVFLPIFCKVFLSLSRYVHITLSFALFFMFSCIISCFFWVNFRTMHKLSFFLCIKPYFMKLIKLTNIDHEYNSISTKSNDQLHKIRLETSKSPIYA